MSTPLAITQLPATVSTLVARLGIPYSLTLSAIGGTSPYTFSVPSGTLPTGLTLSSTGVLSGTPSGSEGRYTFTVQVTDAHSATASLVGYLLTLQAYVVAVTRLALPWGCIPDTRDRFLGLGDVFDASSFFGSDRFAGQGLGGILNPLTEQDWSGKNDLSLTGEMLITDLLARGAIKTYP